LKSTHRGADGIVKKRKEGKRERVIRKDQIPRGDDKGPRVGQKGESALPQILKKKREEGAGPLRIWKKSGKNRILHPTRRKTPPSSSQEEEGGHVESRD